MRNSSTLSYGAWRNLTRQVAVSAAGAETTIYVAGLLEKVTRGGTTEYRHLIGATPGTVAVYIRQSSGSNLTYYLHRDHLGSPELITDGAGAAVVSLSFSAYGERRDADWEGPISSAHLALAAGVTRHGYTDHQELDSVNLIHMNGRVYDPVIGRFQSRDPYIDGLDSSQGPNGYAYVWNNPMSRWDPSGFGDLENILVPGSPWPQGGHSSGFVHMVSGVGGGGGHSRPNMGETPPPYVRIHEDGTEEVIVTAHQDQPPPSSPFLSLAPQIKAFLCRSDQADGTQEMLHTIDNAGTVADISSPAIALGASAASISRGVSSPQGVAFAGRQVADAVSVTGRIGTVVSGIAIIADLDNEQWTTAVYDTVDAGVYWGLGALGTAGAATTAGHTLAVTGMVMGAYALNGGSKGMVQSVLCE